jgi:phosphoglycolate phosphatase
MTAIAAHPAAHDRAPQWRGLPLRAVLLDLDGTLLDTVEDIAKALNRALTEIRFAALPAAEVRNMIGGGAPTLIDRAIARLGGAANTDSRAILLQRFEFHYGRLHRLKLARARVYPGAAQGLRELQELGLKLAVVTNKARPFAVELLNQLGLGEWIDLVVGGECCPRRKPSPEPLLFACSGLDIESREALMVGDSVNDVVAARAAGIPVVCVPYGYNEGRDPRELTCDAFIESLAELPRVLAGEPRSSN